MPKKQNKAQMRLPSNPPNISKASSKIAKKVSKDVLNKINQVNNKKKQRVIKSSRGGSFGHGLKHPFDPKTLGLQVPDAYSFPTVTFHSHTTTVLGTELSNGTAGTVLVLPNPLLSLVDVSHMTLLNAGNKAVTTTPLNRYGVTDTLANSCFYGATSLSDLAGKLTTFRVSSWGFTIRNLQPQLGATGKIFIAPIPIGDTVPNYAQISNMALATGFVPVTGLTAAAMNTSAILQLPGAFELSIGDLLHGDIQVCGMYTSAGFFEFKLTQYTAQDQSLYYTGDSADFNITTGLATASGLKDPTRMIGGVGFIVHYEGLPAATANAIELELIYHIEGSPQISTASVSQLVPTSHASPYSGSTQDVESGMREVSTLDRVVKFLERGAEFLNDNSEGIMNTARVINQAINAFYH